MTETTAPELLTTREVAERLRVKPATVIGWIKRGELAAINVATGNRKLPLYRVTDDDLAAWVESRRQKGTGAGA